MAHPTIPPTNLKESDNPKEALKKKNRDCSRGYLVIERSGSLGFFNSHCSAPGSELQII